ncbi:hypothetical protein [Glycomyces tenuis]|nr:hypothetical protein [Glycomyces tenuis]
MRSSSRPRTPIGGERPGISTVENAAALGRARGRPFDRGGAP